MEGGCPKPPPLFSRPVIYAPTSVRGLPIDRIRSPKRLTRTSHTPVLEGRRGNAGCATASRSNTTRQERGRRRLQRWSREPRSSSADPLIVAVDIHRMALRCQYGHGATQVLHLVTGQYEHGTVSMSEGGHSCDIGGSTRIKRTSMRLAVATCGLRKPNQTVTGTPSTTT